MLSLDNREAKKKGRKVAKSLMLWSIDNFVRQPPYITILSKKQLYFGNGVFKHSDYPKGMLGALDWKIPSNNERQKKRSFYGYDVMRTPFEVMNKMINSAAREMIASTVNGNYLSDVRAIVGLGYINEDGKLDPNQTKGVSCYVFFLADKRIRDKQQEWIKAQKKYVRLQIFRNQQTHNEHFLAQERAAHKTLEMTKKILALEEYKQLETGISRNEITWESDD